MELRKKRLYSALKVCVVIHVWQDVFVCQMWEEKYEFTHISFDKT